MTTQSDTFGASRRGKKTRPAHRAHACRLGLYKQLVSRVSNVSAQRQQAAVAAAVNIAAAAAAAAGMSDSAAATEAALAAAGARPIMHVATVGAQLRGLTDITQAMCLAAGVSPDGSRLAEQHHTPHADALLLLSGSHPVRQLPLMRQVLPGSVQMLQQAVQLKQQGVLPQQLELWAVANPVIEQDASYTEQKVGEGWMTEGSVTQGSVRMGAGGGAQSGRHVSGLDVARSCICT